MVLVDGQGSSDEDRAEQRREEGDLLPVGRPVVGHDLELSVQEQRKEDEASGGGSRVTGRERLERCGTDRVHKDVRDQLS
jgi:hypothetical protein